MITRDSLQSMDGFRLRFPNADVHRKGQNLVSFRSLPEEQVSMLRQKCRENNVTMLGPLRGHRIVMDFLGLRVGLSTKGETTPECRSVAT